MKERISEMAKLDPIGTIQVIVVIITMTLESLNLKRPMNNSQVFDLAEAIVDDAGPDQIAIEDVMLFCQQLIRGYYGEMYESMDVAKFLNWFGRFRDDRYDAFVRWREEKHEERKKMGDDNLFDRTNKSSPIGEELLRHTQSIQKKKDEIALLKRENNNLKIQRDF
jgi:hypothetical protein